MALMTRGMYVTYGAERIRGWRQKPWCSSTMPAKKEKKEAHHPSAEILLHQASLVMQTFGVRGNIPNVRDSETRRVTC